MIHMLMVLQLWYPRVKMVGPGRCATVPTPVAYHSVVMAALLLYILLVVPFPLIALSAGFALRDWRFK